MIQRYDDGFCGIELDVNGEYIKVSDLSKWANKWLDYPELDHLMSEINEDKE